LRDRTEPSRTEFSEVAEPIEPMASLVGETAASPRFREEHRVPALDGVRGIAILFVFLFHTRPSPSLSGACHVWNSAFSLLWSGVDLFFVLSGFLITGILLNTKDHPKYFVNFFARRTLRIFPLYYGVLTGLFVLLPLLSLLPATPLRELLSSEYYRRLWENQIWLWFYVQNFLQARGNHQLPGLGHFWSLAIEEQFYLIWPFLVYCLSERGMLRLSILILCLGLPLRWLMVDSAFDTWAIRHLTYTRIDTLAAGATLAILVRRFPKRILIRTSVGLTGLSAAGLAILIWTTRDASTSTEMMTVWGYTLFALFFSGFILAVSQGHIPSFLMRTLTHPVLVLLGTLSYGIYVFHWPIVHGVRAGISRIPLSTFGGSPVVMQIAVLIITAVLTLIAALFSWRIYESRFLRLKRFFRYSDF
jgi:peptidoglycan/LPS O-acetylase OafA/YrhL